jgi:integrase
MANTTRPLTNTEVKQAKPRIKEYNLADGGGLALRIKPSGSKYWIFNYSRPYTKKRANISFGCYPDLSLANARIKREEARKLLAQDIDPKEHKDDQTQQEKHARDNTLKYVSKQWFDVKKSKITPGYATDIWSSFNLHIFPSLGKLPIHKVTAPKAIATLKPIAAKGSLETVKRLSQRLNEVMIYAVNTGILDANPLAGIGKAFRAPEKRNMPTLKPEQLPTLMQSLTTASIKLTTRCLIEWQLHTMVRPSEAAGTRWDEIDEKNALWHIPADRMKKGKSHTVPLSPHTLALLEVMRPVSGNREYLFPADRNPRKHTHQQTANTALRRMGFIGSLVAHGLRALASTTLNEQGFDPDVIEAALAHVDSNDVRRAYNRADYLERRKVMMCSWSKHIEEAATGNMSLTNKRLRAV